MTGSSRNCRPAFTLLETLVTVAIIALLAGVLLPSLAMARDSAKSLTCCAAIRSLGQAVITYTVASRDVYPAAYIYTGMQLDVTTQTPATPTDGITHWSSYLFGARGDHSDALTCPTFSKRGLPPANTAESNLEPGQVPLTPGVIDRQATRSAYTLNEALCPRNRFTLGMEGTRVVSRFVRTTEVRRPGSIILGTEWTRDWTSVHCPGTIATSCQSYLPVHGFVGIGPIPGGDRYDMNRIGNPHPCYGDYRKVQKSELSADPETATYSRLDWVGRNHGRSTSPTGKKSNFVYADGHGEAKSIDATLQPFEWGDRCYSITPRDMAQ